MLETLKTLSNLIIPEHRQLTLEQIAEQYKKDLNPSLLAIAFEKTYKLTLNLSSNYFGLSQEDIASYSLEKLDQCLQTYEKGNAAFTTYYSIMIGNKFREETQALTTHKRKAIFHSESYEVMRENGFDLVSPCQENSDLIETLSSYSLTDREFEYCKLILSNYTNSEISKYLGVSVMTLSNMRKNLRQKLMPLSLQF